MMAMPDYARKLPRSSRKILLALCQQIYDNRNKTDERDSLCMSTTTRQQDTSHEETHSGTRRGGRALRRPWADLWRKIQGRRSSLYASRHRFARPLQRRPKNIQNWLCILLVFVAGAAAL